MEPSSVPKCELQEINSNLDTRFETQSPSDEGPSDEEFYYEDGDEDIDELIVNDYHQLDPSLSNAEPADDLEELPDDFLGPDCIKGTSRIHPKSIQRRLSSNIDKIRAAKIMAKHSTGKSFRESMIRAPIHGKAPLSTKKQVNTQSYGDEIKAQKISNDQRISHSNIGKPSGLSMSSVTRETHSDTNNLAMSSDSYHTNASNCNVKLNIDESLKYSTDSLSSVLPCLTASSKATLAEIVSKLEPQEYKLQHQQSIETAELTARLLSDQTQTFSNAELASSMISTLLGESSPKPYSDYAYDPVNALKALEQAEKILEAANEERNAQAAQLKVSEARQETRHQIKTECHIEPIDDAINDDDDLPPVEQPERRDFKRSRSQIKMEVGSVQSNNSSEPEGSVGTSSCLNLGDDDDDVYIDTKELCKKIAYELKQHSIPQAVFAERILCRSQGTLSDLLRNPKPWDKLKSGRETFKRMNTWVQQPLEVRLVVLDLYRGPSLPSQMVASLSPPTPAQNSRHATKLKLSSSVNNNINDEAEDGGALKRPRLVFSDIQKKTLQAIFKETQRPSREMQQTIAEHLSLDISTVANFFMNARRRSRNAQSSSGEEPSDFQELLPNSPIQDDNDGGCDFSRDSNDITTMEEEAKINQIISNEAGAAKLLFSVPIPPVVIPSAATITPSLTIPTPTSVPTIITPSKQPLSPLTGPEILQEITFDTRIDDTIECVAAMAANYAAKQKEAKNEPSHGLNKPSEATTIRAPRKRPITKKRTDINLDFNVD
uniref:One cut domain family member n=1 Tax=Rhabditophanes sp. KR3021 TaxID=114890 RepID=A0AC35U6N2_9BILA